MTSQPVSALEHHGLYSHRNDVKVSYVVLCSFRRLCSEVLATNTTSFSIKMMLPQRSSSALIILTYTFEKDKIGEQNLSIVLRLPTLSHTHAYPWNGPYLSPPLAFQPTTHPPNHQLLAIFIVSATISLNTAVASNPIRPLIRPQ